MAWTSRFTDAFTEASADTNLPSHTPTTGTAWTALSVPSGTHAQAAFTDDTLIQPYYAGTSNNFYTADWGTAYNANMQRAEIANTLNPTAGAGRAAAVNLQAGVDGYLAVWDAGVSRTKSYRVDNSAFTELESIIAGSAASLTGVSNETGTIWAWVAGSHVGSGVADATYTGGSCGLITRKAFTSAGGDNYEAFDEAAAGTSGNWVLGSGTLDSGILQSGVIR